MSANEKSVKESLQPDNMCVIDHGNFSEEIKKFNDEAALAIINKYRLLHPANIADLVRAFLDAKFPQPFKNNTAEVVEILVNRGWTSERIDNDLAARKLAYANNKKILEAGENKNVVVLERLLGLMNIKHWEHYFEMATQYSSCIGYVLKFVTENNKDTIQIYAKLFIKHGATLHNAGPGWYSKFDHSAAIHKLFDIEAEKHQALGAGILTAFENSAGGNAVSGFINIIQGYVPTTMEFEVLEEDGKTGKITL